MDELIFEMIMAASLGIPSILLCVLTILKYRTDKGWESVKLLLYVCIIFLSLFLTIFEVVWLCKILSLPV